MAGGPRCAECGAGACSADSTRLFGELYPGNAKGSVPGGLLVSGRSGGPREYPHPIPSHTSPGSEQVELTWDLHPSVVLLGRTSLPRALAHRPSLGRGLRAEEGGVQPVWGAGRAQPSLGTGDVPRNGFGPCMGTLGPAMGMMREELR